MPAPSQGVPRSPVRAAVAVFTVVSLLGLGAVALAAATDRPAARPLDVEHDRIVETLFPGDRVCEGRIRPPEPIAGVRFWIAGRAPAVIRVAVRSDDNRRRLAAGIGRGGRGAVTVRLSRTVVPRGPDRVVQICLGNRGRSSFQLAGDQPSQLSGVLHTHGVTTNLAVAMTLVAAHPATLLSRVPDLFARAARFKASWVGAWTFWLLAALIPVACGLVGIGLARAVRGETAPGGGRGARRRSPLGSLLGATAILGVGWALLVPAWQAPDELDHYAYVESLAARGALPGDPRRPGWSSSQRAAVFAVGAQRVAGRAPDVQPSTLPDVERQLRRRSRRLPRSDGGGPLTASANPPLAYAAAVPGYLAAGGGSALDRLYAIRLWTVVLLLATVAGGWLLAGEFLAARPLARFAATAALAGEPMLTFVSSSVTPDALMITLWTFALWLAVRVARGGARRREVVGLALLTAAAVLTKATSYSLVPAAVLAIVLGRRRRSGAAPAPAETEGRERRSTAAAALAALTLPIGLWLLVAGAGHRKAVNGLPPVAASRLLRPGRIVDFLWQFHLPRLPVMRPFAISALPTPSGFHYVRLPALHVRAPLLALPAYDIWVKGGWGAFGWTEVQLPGWVDILLGLVSLLVLALAAAEAARAGRRGRRTTVAVLGLAAAGLLAGLYATEYESVVAGAQPVLQGRYLLPLIGLFGLAAGVAVARLPRRVLTVVVAAGSAGLIVLEVLALGTVLRAYYA